MATGSYNVLRKRYFHNSSKVENHSHKNGYRYKNSNSCPKQWGFENLSSLASGFLGGGHDGHRQREGFVDRYGNKEHGDLHAATDSTEVADPQSQAQVSRITKFGDATQIPSPKKKRKFLPILWDRDDKEVRISSKIRIVRRSSPCSLLSVPVSDLQLPSRRCHVTPCSPENHVTNGLFEAGIVESLTDLIAPVSAEPYSNNDRDHELENLEEEEYIVERNISTSKWADVDSPKTLPCTSSSSPESGEFWREGFEKTKKRSGSAKAACFAGSSSEDEHSVNGLEDDDIMKIDENCHDVAGVSNLDSDAEDDNDCSRIQVSAFPKHRRINMLQGCRSVFEYEKLNKINEGTYGVVFKAMDKETGEIVALKKVKMAAETEGFPVTSLREINILMSLQHPAIVEVKEVVTDDLDGVFMVMEYMEHDLKGLLEAMKQPFSQSEVKCLMLQLLEGVKSLHDNWVLHRDLKTSNILLNNRGELKICDFGMSRQYGSPLKPYTPLVVTLWYRAPEILLGAKHYSTAIDMWSVGCIMAELLAKEPLFNGRTELEQLDKKFPAATFTGSPALTELGFDLLNKLLTYDPNKRITAEDALNHGWFQEVPLPKSKDFMPTFPAQRLKPNCKPIITHRSRA
ncbi:hypothetical protein LguiB_008027 [Lonicera macranthoides]